MTTSGSSSRKRVNEVLKSDDVDGVVITHGTDTMEETAYFLDLVVKSDKPVVLVGSMRPATAVSADGPGNLYNAVAVAASPRARGRGVLVVMNDEIHAARDVEKMNTTNVDTFASPDARTAGPRAHRARSPGSSRPTSRTRRSRSSSVANVEKLPRVDIIYAHANMPPDLIQASVKNGAKGVVVAGVGDGNMTSEAAQALEKVAKENNVVVVRRRGYRRAWCCATTRSTTTRPASSLPASSTRPSRASSSSWR